MPAVSGGSRQLKVSDRAVKSGSMLPTSAAIPTEVCSLTSCASNVRHAIWRCNAVFPRQSQDMKCIGEPTSYTREYCICLLCMDMSCAYPIVTAPNWDTGFGILGNSACFSGYLGMIFRDAQSQSTVMFQGKRLIQKVGRNRDHSAPVASTVQLMKILVGR